MSEKVITYDSSVWTSSDTITQMKTDLTNMKASFETCTGANTMLKDCYDRVISKLIEVPQSYVNPDFYGDAGVVRQAFFSAVDNTFNDEEHICLALTMHTRSDKSESTPSSNYTSCTMDTMYVVKRQDLLDRIDTLISNIGAVWDTHGASGWSGDTDARTGVSYEPATRYFARRNATIYSSSLIAGWYYNYSYVFDSENTASSVFSSTYDSSLKPYAFYRGLSTDSYYVSESSSSDLILSRSFLAAGCINSSGKDAKNPEGSESASSGKYPSTALGGLGTFDDSTALSDISTKPTIDISSLGFFSVWNPTTTNLSSLADLLWNDPLSPSEWWSIITAGGLKLQDYIISLGMLPISSTDLTLSIENFCIGGIPFDGSHSAMGLNQVLMPKVTEQIVDVDCGEVDLNEYYGGCFDYAPFTNISLYLPFYGFVELSTNEVQNSKVKIVYRINILDGQTVIKVHLTRLNKNNGSVDMQHTLYEFNCNCKMEIPITSGNNSELLKMGAQFITAAVSVAAPIAGAGVGALAGAGISAAVGGGSAAALSEGLSGLGTGFNMGSKIGNSVSNAGGKVVNTMPSGGGIQRGNISSMGFGYLGERKPFLLVTRPIQVMPDGFAAKKGYPSCITTKLSSTSGYVQVDEVHLTDIENCTNNEKDAIVSALKSGVMI